MLNRKRIQFYDTNNCRIGLHTIARTSIEHASIFEGRRSSANSPDCFFDVQVIKFPPGLTHYFQIYSSPNIVRVIKSRRMRWAGHVARMGMERECIESWWGNRREIDNWGDLGADRWIILGWISSWWDVVIWTGLGWPSIETVGGRL